jgi:transposase-like protein
MAPTPLRFRLGTRDVLLVSPRDIVAAEKRWTRPPKGWSQALNQFAIKFEGRLSV